jgi:hypothetical protein
MTKIVINRCWGGFGLSDEAFGELLKRKGVEFESRQGKYSTISYYAKGHLDEDDHYISPYDYTRGEQRADPDLVAIVEEMGEKSWGNCAELKIVEIPDDVEWEVDEYDGMEHVAEKHRTWV